MSKLQSAIVAVLLSVICAASIAQTDGGASRINFGGQDYVHRWSKDGQHEYTPPDETDLKKWRHMVTIIVHEKVKNGDDLAKLANAVLANYERVGKVVRTDSKPRTSTTEAEHLVVVVFGRPGFVEAAFARVKLVAGTGKCAVAVDAQCSDPHPARSDRHVDGSRLCLDPRGLLPPRRPIYWPNISGAALELDTRNERNQLGPPCKPVASSRNCKI